MDQDSAVAMANTRQNLRISHLLTTTDLTLDVPVRKTITVKASPERAFRAFTQEFDSSWPRSHHIGKAPLKTAIIQGTVGGRCYTEQTDGTECDWARFSSGCACRQHCREHNGPFD
jgi:hypothetical protein